MKKKIEVTCEYTVYDNEWWDLLCKIQEALRNEYPSFKISLVEVEDE